MSKANINVQDKHRRTALHIGIEKKFEPVTAREKASRKRDKRYFAALQ